MTITCINDRDAGSSYGKPQSPRYAVGENDTSEDSLSTTET